jgi:putative transposase
MSLTRRDESCRLRRRSRSVELELKSGLAHAQLVIEAWRREYNEERPKKGLGGLTPAAYAKPLMKETSTVTAGL